MGTKGPKTHLQGLVSTRLVEQPSPTVCRICSIWNNKCSNQKKMNQSTLEFILSIIFLCLNQIDDIQLLFSQPASGRGKNVEDAQTIAFQQSL